MRLSTGERKMNPIPSVASRGYGAALTRIALAADETAER
jgi:hypothetical protein